MFKNRITVLIASSFMACLLVLSSVAHAKRAMQETTTELTPVGTWQTIDEATQKPKSVIQIWEKDGKLYGKIKRVLFLSEENKNGLCGKCTGAWHNKPIEGMTNIWGLQQDPENPLKWIDGQILDPKNGKTYHCQMTVSEDGKELNVHGYVGVPLFGRTQTWSRITDE
jgi:uncharacterized protein (DUF2147 family)